MLRIARDIKAKDLADKLGVSPSYIHAVENGSRKPSDRLMRDYAKALDVEIELLEDYELDPEEGFELAMLSLLHRICGIK